MRKGAYLTAQAILINDFERLDIEVPAGDAPINFGQQADLDLWPNLAVLPDGIIDLDTDLACSVSEREVVLPLMGDDVPGDGNVTAKSRGTDLRYCAYAPCCTRAGKLGGRGRGKCGEKQNRQGLLHGVVLHLKLRREACSIRRFPLTPSLQVNVRKHITISASLRMEERQISRSTHRQALSALLFVSRDVLVDR